MTARVTAALRLVELVAARPDPTAPVAVGALARELGLSLSSVSRMCSELDAAGFLTRGEGYGSYGLGPEAIRLSGRAAAPVSTAVRYALTLAAQQTGETACLAVEAGGTVRVVAGIDSIWTLHSPAVLGEVVDDPRSAILQAAGEVATLETAPVLESTIGMSVELAAAVLTPAGERVAVVAIRLPANRLEQNGPRARRAVEGARRLLERAVAEQLESVREPGPGPEPGLDEGERAGAPSALEGALRILRHLARGSDGLSGIARGCGLRPDRAGRLLESCREAGFVRADADGGRFQLGWIVHGWHRAAAIPLLVARGKPIVAAASQRLRLCAFVTTLKGMRSFTLVEELDMAGEGLAMAHWLGRAHPIIGSDGGPTLLMDFGPADLAVLFPARHTAKELERFLVRVRKVSRDGVLSMEAFDGGGMTSVSAPIRDASGAVVAAACLVGTNSYMDEHAAEFVEATRTLAAEVSAVLA